MPDRAPDPAVRRDVERNRNALLEAAADELARHPGASMVDIARAAGLTRATLYRHFGTREKLVEGLQDEALTRAAQVLVEARLEQGPAPEALHRAILGLARLGARFRPLLAEGAEADPDFLQRRAAVLAPLEQVVRRGQSEGTMAPDLPPAWLLAALASLLTAATRSIATSGADADELGELVHRTLVRGILTSVTEGTDHHRTK